MSEAEFRADESPSMDFGAPTTGAAYRVLARKYRPATFADLIGQDAMVRTLDNAFEAGRIPQAWILTGVRGVGKTTTARILARALNYETDAVRAPTTRMPDFGMHCRAIMESRHVDVLEMDAASHNGVDDVRQINDAVRYAPASARYKVYILDEVHMLTTQAFNALLKTLEEPPPHVKFVFATTDIRKVPVTILSRCQRFDLRRIDADMLVAHLGRICAQESVEAEPEALALIARAAEGSVRDALSLLDQAIAHAAGPVRADDVRGMLGLVDRARIIDLFEALMRGDMAAALQELRAQYEIGADPAVTLVDLSDFTHLVTRIKLVPPVAEDRSLTETERARGRDFAAALSMRVLSRTWQMLLKGIAEVQSAAKPLPAAEMVLVRIAYAADLPSPEEAIRTLAGQSESASAASPARTAPRAAAVPAPAPRAEPPPRGALRAAQARAEPAPDPSAHAHIAAAEAPTPAAPVRSIARFEDLIALAAEKRDIVMQSALERDVRLVRLEEGRLELALEPGASKSLLPDLSRKLTAWTGRQWMVAVSGEAGQPTVRAQKEERRAALHQGLQADPVVQAVLARFPGAEITRIVPREDAAITQLESAVVEDAPDAAWDPEDAGNDDDL